jgi:hypothetical protein
MSLSMSALPAEESQADTKEEDGGRFGYGD